MSSGCSIIFIYTTIISKTFSKTDYFNVLLIGSRLY